MDITINGEKTKLPADDDLTLGETEMVAKHLGIDVGAGMPSERFMGLVFIAIRRMNPDAAIVDQVEQVRQMRIADLEIEEVASADPLPATANGKSETTLVKPGAPV